MNEELWKEWIETLDTEEDYRFDGINLSERGMAEYIMDEFLEYIDSDYGKTRKNKMRGCYASIRRHRQR